MPNNVIISPKGLHSLTWSKEKKKNIKKKVKKSTIITCLRAACEIEEGTTLKDIFNIVENNKYLKLIISQYSWCREIGAFHAQANEPIYNTEEEDDEKIDFLEIYWHADHQEYKNETSFGVSTGLHGIGKAKEDDKFAAEDGLTRYSVSCTPMNELANLPVKLNENITVYSAWKLGKGKHEKPHEIIKAEKYYTLLDVLDAIYWDISFYGGPADNKDMIDSLKETMEEVMSGQVAAVPIEQILKRTDPNYKSEEEQEGEFKIVVHPDVARMMGVDPDSIPLDDREIIRREDNGED